MQDVVSHVIAVRQLTIREIDNGVRLSLTCQSMRWCPCCWSGSCFSIWRFHLQRFEDRSANHSILRCPIGRVVVI